jgi:hypothetical protein
MLKKPVKPILYQDVNESGCNGWEATARLSNQEYTHLLPWSLAAALSSFLIFTSYSASSNGADSERDRRRDREEAWSSSIRSTRL